MVFFDYSPTLSQNLQYSFKHINISSGLSQNSVVSIIEDDLGFIWFGSTDGLNRYDGYEIKVYKHINDDPNSICANSISHIVKDKSGKFWIATGNGLSLYDPVKNKFTNYFNNPGDPGTLPDNKVQDLIFQNDTTLWLATENGLSKLNTNNRIFENYYHNPRSKNSPASNDIIALECKDDSVLWIGTFGKGVDRLNLLTWDFTHFKRREKDPFSLPHNYIRDILIDKNNTVWIGTEFGLAKKIEGRDRFKVYQNTPYSKNSLSNNWAVKIFEHGDGNLWIGTDGGGINILDTETNAIQTIQPSSLTSSISDNRIYEIYQDGKGLIWIGTWGDGVNLLNPYAKKFYTYTSEQNNRNTLIDKHVFCFSEIRKNKFIIGTLGGISIFDYEKDTFTPFRFKVDPSYNNALNFLFCMTEGKKNTLWIGTREGLIKFNKIDFTYKIFRNDPYDSNSLNYNGIWSLYYDNDTLWIGTGGGGLDEYILKENKFLHHVVDVKNPNSISSNAITDIEKDSKGNLWLTTEAGGISILNAGTQKFMQIKHIPDNNNSLATDNTTGLLIKNDTCVWIATSMGLNKYNPNLKSFELFDESDGLPNNYIYSMLEDNSGNLWLGTNLGLSKFDPANNAFTNFSELDGLQSNEFNSGSCLKLSDGKMLFGGVNGFNLFNPDKITNNSVLPRIHITEMQILNSTIEAGKEYNNNIILSKSILYTDELTLSYEDKVIAFKYAALNYIVAHDNQYAYKLDGFEDEWNFVGNRRFAIYTNLTPGEYTFMVKGSNNDGLWNETPAKIKITIDPPYWSTIWFIFLFVSFFFTIILIAHRINIRQINKQRQLLENEVVRRTAALRESNATKDKFFSILAHDLRGPFNSLLGNTELLSTDIDNLSKDEIKVLSRDLNLSLEQVYKLLENLLQWSRIQQDSLDFISERINLKQVIEDNHKLLSNNFTNKKIEFHLEVPNNLFVLGDQNMVNSIFQNLMTNSLKFTHSKGRISITSYIEEDFIITKVSDTGVGIQESNLSTIFKIDGTYSTPGTDNEKGSGLGLILCKEFALKNGGDISVVSEKNKGTTFTVKLPNFTTQ